MKKLNKQKPMLKNFICKYRNVYIFILENEKSLKCVGWGNEYEFKSKFWNYLVYDYNNSYSDKTTTLILAKDESVEMI